MPHDSSPKNNEYKASSIKVIEGLEAVRKRPAMYIGSTGPGGLHHLVYEVVDNSVDEALGGHANNINVILHTDGSCSVEDNGRGIPTDIHPTEGVSAAEVVLTKLHAGGKFDKESYKFSGGLHGVGISVVNALSIWLDLTIFQHGKVFFERFEQGKPVDRLKEIGNTKKRGTLVRFKPDPEIFQETTEFSFETISARLREYAFLNKKLRITIVDERTSKSHEFYFEGGIVSFVEHINQKKNPLFNEVINFEHEDDKYILEIAMQYNEGYGEQLFSFVNNINTVDGGTHVSGFKGALTKVCNKKAYELGVLKQGTEGFSSEDVREGLVAVLSIKVPEPQFEGQTKTKLGNNEVKGIVESWTSSSLETYFEEHPSIARKILLKAETASRARDAAKKARDIARRKTVLESTILPGKLADCSNEDPTKTELFIVEGDSAGGSAKQARDRQNQAILPLKGKILNVEKARIDRILSNDEIKALISAVGGGIGEDFDLSRVRYHKIILMTDADVDGAHIRTLLLTFFFRHMRHIIDSGYLYIAQPPLYKAKIGKKEQYIKDDKTLQSFLFDWAREQTQLFVLERIQEDAVWHKILEKIYEYEDTLTQLSIRYRLGFDQCHRMITVLRNIKWNDTKEISVLLEGLRASFPGYDVIIPINETESAEPMPIAHTKIIFKRLTMNWAVPVSFFSAPEVHHIATLINELSLIEDNDWHIIIRGKEKGIEDLGIKAISNAIRAISKPFMHIQRYKGLGEMNPDQLWETAMDGSTRLVLKVSIEDGLEADRWFTTLMGDDVAGRREYIEEYGQFVKNLDV